MKETRIISIDPGTETSGLALIDSGSPFSGSTEANSELFNIIHREYRWWASMGWKCYIVIEDIAPYKMIGFDTLNTVKFIGELSWRLKEAHLPLDTIYRWQVKKWCYDHYNAYCKDKVEGLIRIRDYRNQDGQLRRPQFSYVDDRMVTGSMKLHYGMETPKPGKSNPLGFSGHSWQALAAGTVFMANHLAHTACGTQNTLHQ